MPDEPGRPRPAEEADLPALRAIVDGAYRRYLDRMDRKPAPMLQDLGPSVRAGEVWVIGRPATGLICLRRTGDALLVENVAVRPEAQGRGIGRRLMEFAEERARATDARRLRLYTNEVMTENVAIYRHLGYRVTEHRTDEGYRRVFLEMVLDRR